MRTPTRTLNRPIVLFQTYNEMTAAGRTGLRRRLEMIFSSNVEVTAAKRSPLTNVYPDGGTFIFAQGSTELFCEVLPRGVSSRAINEGALPGGSCPREKFQVMALTDARLAIGNALEVPVRHVAWLRSRVEIVRQRRFRDALAQKLAFIGVPLSDMDAAIGRIERRLMFVAM